MLLDPPSRHTHLCMRERAFASCYHPATILFFPPPQLKILYETLNVVSFSFLCTEILGRTSMHGYSYKRCPIHLALYTCMDGCAHPNLWSRSKSLLSVANNLMCMYRSIFCLITQWTIYAAWFLIYPCTLLSSRDLCDLEIQELEAVATWAHQGRYGPWGFLKSIYLVGWNVWFI